MGKKARKPPEINSGSMADIAFLLLIFFLVTTTIASDKGISVMLPPKVEKTEIDINARNIFNVLINSNDLLLVEEQVMDVSKLKAEAKRFINNRKADPNSSDSPKDAVISLKTDRGTSYEKYIEIRDILKQAYAELRAEYLGITLEQYALVYENRLKDPKSKDMYERSKEEFPEQVSDAEPTDATGAK